MFQLYPSIPCETKVEQAEMSSEGEIAGRFRRSVYNGISQLPERDHYLKYLIFYGSHCF